jgi:4-hydroxy-tetrahydrodipicolinate synthase
VNVVILLGTCGEGPSLSPRLQRELIERVCRQVDGRLPVLVGVTDSSPVQSTALARHAADAGADAIVIAPPFYFPLEQSELLAYVEQQIADSPLPVMLYNMPGLCKVVYEPETVRRLLANPRVIGLKDSSGDLVYFRRVHELTRSRADWTLLIGPEHLLDEAIAIGGHGGVSGGANLVPQLYVKYYEAAVAGFVDEAAAFESDVALLGHIYTVGATDGLTASSVVKGLKAALAVQGVCSGLPCPPLAPLSAEQVEQVRHILRDVGSRAAAMAAQQQ